MSYRIEFSNFPETDMPTVPEGWEDVSWHNNAMPSFRNHKLGLELWIDYADPALRESIGEQASRFCIFRIDAFGEWTDDKPCFEGNDWQDVLRFIEAQGA